jgi:hypothetical protein
VAVDLLSVDVVDRVGNRPRATMLTLDLIWEHSATHEPVLYAHCHVIHSAASPSNCVMVPAYLANPAAIAGVFPIVSCYVQKLYQAKTIAGIVRT